MPYTIDPANAAEPTDGREAGYMAAELRALKAYLNPKLAEIAAGQFDLSYLAATGTRDATTFLRGDGTWAAMSGAVTSFNGRGGAVVPTTGDYSYSQLSGTPNLPLASTINSVPVGYRTLPTRTIAGAGAGVIDDRGKVILIGGAFNIPPSVFSAGDAFIVYNNTGGALNVTKDAALTLQKAGTSSNATISLASHGIMQLLFLTNTLVLASGVGMT